MQVDMELLVNCPKCDVACVGELTPELKHYGKARCHLCNNFWWIPKPDDDPSKYKRPKSSTNLARKDYCESCLRRREELPKNTTLEGHHVIEHQNGGDDSDNNIWTLCTACHRLIHWSRTYRGESA